ncbi:SusD/RagB family nutrient-binding outer membrane lipoprotein [Ekhidna sp.]
MKKIISSIALSLILLTACDFNEFQDDPNRTIEAPPGLILTNLIVNTFNNLDNSAQEASRMMTWVDGQSSSQYYNWQRSGFGAYGNIRQTAKMIEEAERLSLPNYIALAKFFQAFHYYQLTMAFGDIPFSDALGGFDDEYQPTYDDQESVFSGILALLDEANDELSNGEPDLIGDVMFNGNITMWKKAINTFRLRVLMTLSNQDGSSSIDISGQFNDIVGDPATYPIMESNDDNLALQHFDIAGSRYPFFDNQNFKVAFPLEITLVNLLKDRNDPRLFQIATMNSNGTDPMDFDSYGGIDGSAPFEEFQAQFLSGEASFPALRYSDDPTAEASVTMGYSELQFILAEAVVLGWIAGDAQVFYNNGITASMQFYGIDDADITTYLGGSNVIYSGANAIEMINTQKYLTYFLSSGWEPFYNQRRTGFPTFSTTDFNDGQVPVRWMYPQSELNLNTTNVESAIQSQFGGEDTINGQMWLLQ